MSDFIVLYSTIYLQVKCTKTRLTTVMTRVRMRKDRLIEMSDCTVYLLVKCTKTRLTTAMTYMLGALFADSKKICFNSKISVG